jgi:hypothetical protein
MSIKKIALGVACSLLLCCPQLPMLVVYSRSTLRSATSRTRKTLLARAYSTTCESFGNNSVCNQYQPYGPTALTGNEYIPADTGLPGGQNPQTVTVPVILLGAGNTNYSTPLTGTTVTAAATDSTILLEPAGTIAALTVALPAAAALKDGQTLRIASTQTITALTLTPGYWHHDC